MESQTSTRNFETLADKLPHHRSESSFQELKPLMVPEEAKLEAMRCLFCFDAPCIQACPTAINIPQFIQRISTDNIRGAANTILSVNPFGLSCALACPTEVLCEGACVHNKLSKKPIQIGRLQHFAVERTYRESNYLFQAGPESGKRIALLGAGPASLACARELRRFGHATTIFEKSNFLGGLNTWGIAPYKMKAEVSLREIEQIISMGVKFQFEMELGKNLTLQELLNDYDALFLGIGLANEKEIPLPGLEHIPQDGAVNFISKMKVASHTELDFIQKVQTALVVGGGNTALDAARELKQLKIQKVILVYRRSEKEMPGYRHEFLAAREEGVEFYFNTPPDAIASLKLNIGLILLALGRSTQEFLLSEIPELKFKNGNLETNPKTLRTGHSKIFAGGDLINGGKEVVHAVADGVKAARGIHEVLKNG